MRGRAVKQLGGSQVMDEKPNGDVVQGFADKDRAWAVDAALAVARCQISGDWRYDDGACRGLNCCLGREEQRTIALQTGKFQGTVPLYLSETDLSDVVQPVYTVSIYTSVDVVNIPPANPPAEIHRGGHHNFSKKYKKRGIIDIITKRCKYVLKKRHI